MKHKFIFGVFRDGGLVFAFNTITCTHKQAEFLVALLDMGKEALEPGDYFACDYV